jgi:hypothetical protein
MRTIPLLFFVAQNQRAELKFGRRYFWIVAAAFIVHNSDDNWSPIWTTDLSCFRMLMPYLPANLPLFAFPAIFCIKIQNYNNRIIIEIKRTKNWTGGQKSTQRKFKLAKQVYQPVEQKMDYPLFARCMRKNVCSVWFLPTSFGLISASFKDC